MPASVHCHNCSKDIDQLVQKRDNLPLPCALSTCGNHTQTTASLETCTQSLKGLAALGEYLCDSPESASVQCHNSGEV